MGVFGWLFRPSQELDPVEKEKLLSAKADQLEDRATHAERAAELRDRIADAEKRISAVSPPGGFSRLGGGTRLLIGLAVLFLIVFLLAKC